MAMVTKKSHSTNWKLFFYILMVVMSTHGDFVCPPKEEISPCTCWTDEGSPGELSCFGPSTSQVTIDTLFATVRQYNNLSTSDPPGPPLALFAFNLYDTQMTTLDLTPLANTTFHRIDVYSNPNLTKIVTPGEDDDGDLTSSLFTVNTLAFGGDLLSNGGEGESNFVSIFESIDPTLLRVLIVSRNELDFVPNLDKLSDLAQINLGENFIDTIGGGQFKNCGRLTHIFLHDNLIQELGPGAFTLDPLDVPTNQSLFIYLSGNNLTDDRVDEEHGLDKILGRPIVVGFQDNSFEFVAENKFKPFLTVHEQNGLDFSANPLICDERMQWLKDGREFFEHRMFGMYCINDPGHTIFDTDLLPGPKK